MMFSYGDGWAWWQMSLMWVGIVAFWALLIWALFLFGTSSSRGGGEGRDDPRRILATRLARGEIDGDEYRRLRALLKTDDGTHSDVHERS